MCEATDQRVILLHGLGESPLTMTWMELAFRTFGYSVCNIAYPSTLASAEKLVTGHILPLLNAFEHVGRLHFITHSLGGVLLHAALSRFQPANLGRVIMMSPGLRGSDALEVYRRSWLFRMTYGPAASQSGTGDDSFAHLLDKQVEYELGVIAGCVSFDPVANLFMHWPHDGKVAVERTRLRGLADHIVLPTAHDLIVSDPTAIWQALQFIEHGHFFHLLTPTVAGVNAAA